MKITVRPSILCSANRRLFSAPTLSSSVRRMMTSKEHTDFDDEMSRVYSQMSQVHYHPNGPYKKIADAIQTATSGLKTPNILDIASGPGEPAATIARSMPSASVLSTDASEPMFLAASERASEIPNMEARVADMLELGLDDNQFDAISCCYGYMFPAKKDQALRETFRVLKPGGTLVATIWNDVPIMSLMSDIMERILGHTPPRPDLDPLSLSESGLFESLLEEASFQDIHSENHIYAFDMGPDEELTFKATLLLQREKLDELGAWKEAKQAFGELKDNYAHYHKGNMIIDNHDYRCVVAKKPAP